MKTILILLTILLSYTQALGALQTYKAKNSKTSISMYNYGENWISLRFKDSDEDYIYSVASYGKEIIDRMKQLAQSGEGLATYTSQIRTSELHNDKIQSLPKATYCGPRGGEENTAYPIHTRKMASAALSYAHWAKKPDGIRECVCTYYFDFPSCKKQ